MIAVLLAGSVGLSACATTTRDEAATSAAVGGMSIAEGALPGAAIGGMANSVWADTNRDGYVDGYMQDGQYFAGTPQGYDPTLRRVAMGAVGGAAVGAVAGAAIPGVSVVEGALVGAAVGGLAGAVWSDSNGDGRVDGYVYNGQYTPGEPQMAPAPAPQPMAPPAPARGERG